MRHKVNTESESLLQDLMATTVGRRWILKAGLGSAAAIAAAHLPALSRRPRPAPGQPTSAWPMPAGDQPRCHRRQPGKPDHRQDLALRARASYRQAANGVSNLRLIANGVRSPSSPTRQLRVPRSRQRVASSPPLTSTRSPIMSRRSRCRRTERCWSRCMACGAPDRCWCRKCCAGPGVYAGDGRLAANSGSPARLPSVQGSAALPEGRWASSACADHLAGARGAAGGDRGPPPDGHHPDDVPPERGHHRPHGRGHHQGAVGSDP